MGAQEKIAPFLEAAMAPVPIIGELVALGANVVLPLQKRGFDALQNLGNRIAKKKKR